MNDIFLTITTYTFSKIMKLPKQESEQALALYFFYYHHAKVQKTNQPWATVSFCAKGLGWGIDKVKTARRNLKKIGLIEDHRIGIGEKTYVKINFITSEQKLCSVFDYPIDPSKKSTRRKNQLQNALSINKNKCLKNKKDLSKDKSCFADAKQKKSVKLSKRKLPKIVKKTKSDLKSSDSKKFDLKSKYKHTTVDLRNYNELIQNGATNHKKETKAELNSLDNLHALFSNMCKDPYHSILIPEQYINFKWTIDELIDTFKFHLDNAPKYGVKPIKSIGSFIFTAGYNGHKAWSPLLYWHQKMKRNGDNKLTENGKKLHSSMNRSQINGIDELESSTINQIADKLFSVSNKYMFVNGESRNTMMYPFGIVDAFTRYIKEKTNQFSFKLVYIRGEKFIDEFLSVAKERNIIKKKATRRSLYA